MGNITLNNVSKAFGSTVIIPGIDLVIKDGEFVVFVGPSGCGKSTLLRLIAGLEDTSGGSIHIDGRDVTNEAPARRKLAMVFQSYALYPHMSVARNIAFPLKMAGEDKAGSEIEDAQIGPAAEHQGHDTAAQGIAVAVQRRHQDKRQYELEPGVAGGE